MNIGRKIPASNALKKYSVNAPNDMDVIYQPLYDYQDYNFAGQTSLIFFQNPIGQNGKTLDDTNMESAGQMPSPQSFVVEGICIDFFPGNAVGTAGIDATADNAQDVYKVMQSGHLNFVVGVKPRLQQAPLGAFPPNYRMAGMSAISGQNTLVGGITLSDYASFAGQVFSIIPVTLESNQNFSVSLNWKTPVPIINTARIGVKLLGTLYRSIQ